MAESKDLHKDIVRDDETDVSSYKEVALGEDVNEDLIGTLPTAIKLDGIQNKVAIPFPKWTHHHHADGNDRDGDGHPDDIVEIPNNNPDTMQKSGGQENVGKAQLRYRLDQVLHGHFGGVQGCLIVVDFTFIYDQTCPVTRADINIKFGRDESGDDLKRKATEKEETGTETKVDDYPFATDVRWPHKADGPSSSVHISNDVSLKLTLGVSGFSIETPSLTHTTSGDRADGGWRIIGAPESTLSSSSSTSSVQNRYHWSVSGNDLNNYPVPEDFSVGMVVLHGGDNFWAAVDIDGDLRVTGADIFHLGGHWKKLPPKLWRIRAEDNPSVELNDAFVSTTVGEKYKELFKGLQIVDSQTPKGGNSGDSASKEGSTKKQ